jgi:hypothetical protein
VGPTAVLDGCGNQAPAGMRSTNRADRTEPLYRLCYPGPQISIAREQNHYCHYRRKDSSAPILDISHSVINFLENIPFRILGSWFRATFSIYIYIYIYTHTRNVQQDATLVS